MATGKALPETFREFAGARFELSDHAARQWDRRMPTDAVAPETALDESVAVPQKARPLYRTGYHPTPDDVRLYAGESGGERYLAVFIVQDLPDPVCRTVYRAASMRDTARRAYSWALLTEEADHE